MCDIFEQSSTRESPGNSREPTETDSCGPTEGDGEVAADLPDGVRRGELLGALANERRRTILSVLAEERTPMGVPTLARAVAERDSDADGSSAEERVERAHISLYHVDLPKLDAVGVVDYDRDRGTVEASVDDVESLVDGVEALLSATMRTRGGD